MPRILTGVYSASGFADNLEDGTTEYQSSGYVGWKGNIQYGVFLSPGTEEVFELADFSKVTSLTFRLKLKKKTTNQAAAQIGIKWYNSAQSWYSPQSLRDAVQASSVGYELRETVNTTEEQTIERTFTGTLVSYVLQYGIGVYGFSDQFQITEASVEASVSDRYVKPVISLKNGYGQVVNGTYYHYPQNPMTLIVNYSQEAGEPLSQVVAWITPKNGDTGYKNGELGLNSVDIPDYEWRDLPEYGTISLYAISEAGVTSDTITYPFVVAQYDLYYLSYTSGAIIRSDEDVEIGWGAQRPDSLPSAVSLTAPTKYWVYKWWDDEEPRASEATTSLSYTVPAEQLEGHKILHIAVCEEYGDGQSERDADYAPVLNLYIQQVAGTGGVTVGFMYSSAEGLICPAPTVKWESTGQTAYQVQFGDFDSGPIWGADTKYVVPYIFEDGTYPVRVRVQDANGAWSEWSEPVYAVLKNPEQSGTCNLLAEKSGEFVRISAKEMDGVEFDYWCLYRNGEMIAQIPFAQAMEYIDRTATGVCTYSMRMMTGAGAYAQSDSVTIDATSRHDILLPDGSTEAIPLLYTRMFPKSYNYSTNETVSLQHFVGRSYPVSFRSGKKTRTLTMEYVDMTGSLRPMLEDLAGTVVLFKDTLGGKIRGVLNSVTVKQYRKYTVVGFVITQVDWHESVPYIWGGI